MERRNRKLERQARLEGDFDGESVSRRLVKAILLLLLLELSL